jgi:hypothetical protein
MRLRPLLALSTLLGTGCMDWDRFSNRYGEDLSAAHVDAMLDLPDAAPPCDAEICDDFEAATLSSVWTLEQRGGMLALDTSRAHSGRQSVKFTVDNTSPGEAIDVTLGETSTFAVAPRSFYARAYVSGLNAPTDTYGFMTTSQDVPTYQGLAVQVSSTPALAIVDYANGADGYGTYYKESSPVVLLSATGWSCVEWEVIEGDPGNDNGATNVWVDDQPVSSLDKSSMLDTSPNGGPLGILKLGLGGLATKTTDGLSIWIDDVEVAKTRIHCAD